MGRLQPVLARVRWPGLIGSVVITFLLGCLGLWQYSHHTHQDWSLTTVAYKSAQLFLLEGGDLEGDLPLALDTARWLAPVSLAFAAVGTFATLVRRSSWGWGARRAAGHVVVIGLGERGWRVVRSVQERGRRVVVIEADPQAPRIAAARQEGVPVLIGHGDDPRQLRRARLDKAKRVIVLVGEPDNAARIARGVGEWAAQREHQLTAEFCCFVAVDDSTAVRELNAMLTVGRAAVRSEFFSINDRAGVAIVDRWIPDLTRKTVVVGDGVTARSILGAIARESRARGLTDVAVTWVLHEDHTDLVQTQAREQHPALTTIDLRVIDGEQGRSLSSTDVFHDAALVVIAEREDARALRAAALAERESTARIVMVAAARSLTAMLAGHPRVDIFSVDDELCTDAAVAHGRLEEMARALHRGYLRELDANLTAEQREQKRAYRAWDDLAPQLRDSNYAAARAAWTFLSDVGYRVVTRSVGVEGVETLPPHVIDDLARREHARWLRQSAPNAPIPDWSQVDERSRDQSRDQIRRLPETLAAADLCIVPRR